MANAKDIINGRKKVIQEAIEQNHFNFIDYAKYFDTTENQLKKDMIEIYGSDYEVTENPVNYDDLLEYRDSVIHEMVNQGYDEDAILIKLGMWHLPIPEYEQSYESLLVTLSEAIDYSPRFEPYVQKAKEYVKNPSEEILSRFLDQVEQQFPHFSEFLHVYQSRTKIAEWSKPYHISSAQLHNMTQFAQLMGVQSLHYHKAMQSTMIVEALTKLMKDTPIGVDARRCTSYTSSDLKTFKDNGYQYIAPINEIANKRQNIKEQCFNLYCLQEDKNYTIQEIADKFELSRAAIGYYIRSYKKQHPELINKLWLNRPRHIGSEKEKIRAELKDNIVQCYKLVMKETPDMPMYDFIYAVGELDNYTVYIAEQALTEANIKMIGLPEGISEELERQVKIGQKYVGQFHYGSVEENMTYYREGTSDQTPEEFAAHIRLNQRLAKIRALLDQNPEAHEIFTQTGSLKETLSYLQEQKQGLLTLNKTNPVQIRTLIKQYPDAQQVLTETGSMEEAIQVIERHLLEDLEQENDFELEA